ncbi:MAG: primase C-terminal domain-containing protein [Candidatus Bathycorpusculaceae bacterium]
MPQNIREAAHECRRRGLNVVLLCGKQPLHEWKPWQSEKQSQADFEALPWSEADGFAFIGGDRTSEGLYFCAVDFDVKNVKEEAEEKGKQILKRLPITQIEETPSGGQHWIYLCHTKPKTVSAYHNEAALELIGEGKLCIMAPSAGYRRLNDNPPTIVHDLEDIFYRALYAVGVKAKETVEKRFWFDREDLASKRYAGKTPSCIDALFKGTSEGQRNEYAIRLASFLMNFRRVKPENTLKVMRSWNRFNTPPLAETELESVVKSAINGCYVYGCQDPILKQHCIREECPLASYNMEKLLAPEEVERAEKLLEDPKFLDYIVTYGRRRLIGEDNALLTNFVEICSGQTKYPISGVISGFSGSGKNESIRAIKPIIPREWLFEFTTSTPEAIKYIPEDFTGTLIIYEASGVKGDTGTLSLRSIGEGESIETIYPMRNEITGKMEMGKAKTNAKNFITTESDIDIHPDLYRRVLKYTMSHDASLTKRVIAKKMREAQFPESLRNTLGLQDAVPFKEADSQNALRLLNWKAEVVLFPPPMLLHIIDLAVIREQQVALRTHVEKILNFAKVLALINQKRRLRFRVKDAEYVVAEAEDYLKSLKILKTSITETVSRIEKRQREVLQLFSSNTMLTKHEVAAKLKVSARTASRALKTLAAAGYLKEISSSKPYAYESLQKEPDCLDIAGNANEYSLFHEKSLKNFLNNTWTACQKKGISLLFWNNESNSWTEKPSAQEKTGIPLSCPVVHMPFNDEKSFFSEKKPKHFAFSTMSRENSQNKTNLKLEGEKKVDFLWRQIPVAEKCEACGQLAVEYEIIYVKGSQIFRRCKSCFEKMQSKFSSSIWEHANNERLGESAE